MDEEGLLRPLTRVTDEWVRWRGQDQNDAAVYEKRTGHESCLSVRSLRRMVDLIRSLSPNEFVMQFVRGFSANQKVITNAMEFLAMVTEFPITLPLNLLTIFE